MGKAVAQDFYLSPVSLLQIADCNNVRYSIYQNTNSSLLGCTVLMRLTSLHLTSHILRLTYYTLHQSSGYLSLSVTTSSPPPSLASS
jgi:hypothetical protein